MTPEQLDTFCQSDIEGWMMGYLRRTQMEARIQATEIGRLFSGTQAASMTQGSSGKGYQQVSPDALLGRMRG